MVFLNVSLFLHILANTLSDLLMILIDPLNVLLSHHFSINQSHTIRHLSHILKSHKFIYTITIAVIIISIIVILLNVILLNEFGDGRLRSILIITLSFSIYSLFFLSVLNSCIGRIIMSGCSDIHILLFSGKIFSFSLLWLLFLSLV